MRINIEIDNGLMQKAMRITKMRTQRATVQAGLRMLIRTHGQSSMRRLRGKVRWEGDLEVSRVGRIANS